MSAELPSGRKRAHPPPSVRGGSAAPDRPGQHVFVRGLPGEHPTSLTSAPSDTAPGEVVAGASITEPGGPVFGPRIQRRYQVMVVHRGGFLLEREGFSLAVREGDSLLLTPGHVEVIRFVAGREGRL